MSIDAESLQIRAIKLEHTNPSMGPYENIIEIRLAHNEQSRERINQFLEEAQLNEIMSIGAYIAAYRAGDAEQMQRIEQHAPRERLREGETISNLHILFANASKPLSLSDIYRCYSLTKFYGDFSRYMVEHGQRSELGNNSLGKKEKPL